MHKKQSKHLTVRASIRLSLYPLSLLSMHSTSLWKRRIWREGEQRHLCSRDTAPWQSLWAGASPGAVETKLCWAPLSSQRCVTRWGLLCVSVHHVCILLLGFVWLITFSLLIVTIHTRVPFDYFSLGWEITATGLLLLDKHKALHSIALLPHVYIKPLIKHDASWHQSLDRSSVLTKKFHSPSTVLDASHQAIYLTFGRNVSKVLWCLKSRITDF